MHTVLFAGTGTEMVFQLPRALLSECDEDSVEEKEKECFSLPLNIPGTPTSMLNSMPTWMVLLVDAETVLATVLVNLTSDFTSQSRWLVTSC